MPPETQNALAIVGVGGLFPGADSPDALWQNLVDGRDVRTALSRHETHPVDPADYYDPTPGTPDKTYNLAGGFIRDFTFDATGYHLPAHELVALDLTSQWALYAARAALADANLLAPPARTGVILGNLSFPTRTSKRIVHPLYHDVIEATLRDVFADDAFELARPDADAANLGELRTGSYPVDVLHRALGLTGVRLALDAACASSLYAMKLAGDYLLSGRADVMLAGAVSAADPILITGGFSLLHAHPRPAESSSPLSEGSDGLIASEGAGFVVLKRYADARHAGDRIYGVITGVGLSNDGKGKYLLSPLPDRQIVAIRRAHAAATGGAPPVPLQYVECHATGTPRGDRTEIEAMAGVFGDDMPRLGSLKGNLGHCLTAAGMAALFKVLLSMQHEQIPPTINITEPLHPAVVERSMPWEAPHKRAGINAFGFGGTNAHLIVESDLAQPAPSVKFTPTRMAIAGMGVLWGGCEDLAAFERMIFEGASSVGGLPPQRWAGAEDGARSLGLAGHTIPEGAYLVRFAIDAMRYRVQLADDDVPHPQQLAILKAADAAIHDARLAEGSNVAVIVAMETEAELHRFRARIDIGWQIEHSLRQAGITLSHDEREQLIGTCRDAIASWPGVNRFTSYIGNIMAGRVAALGNFSGPAFTVSAGDASVLRALELAQMMLERGEVEAVIVGAVDLAGSMERVLTNERVSEVRIGEGAGAVVVLPEAAVTKPPYAIIESFALSASPDEAIDTALRLSERGGQDIGFVEHAGSVARIIGLPGVAAPLASIIRTALCLRNRYRPTADGDAVETWYVKKGIQRVVGISVGDDAGERGHLILSEVDGSTAAVADSTFATSHEALLLLTGDTADAIVERLRAVRAQLDTGASLAEIVNAALDAYDRNARLCAAFVVTGDCAQLMKELDAAQAAIARNENWQSPHGSAFATQPIRGSVAFVYPGAFTWYPSMGTALMRAFPVLHDAFYAITDDPGVHMGQGVLTTPNDFQRNQTEQFTATLSFAGSMTWLLREVFRVNPDLALGYSMGEGAMFWGNRVWHDGDSARQLLATKPVLQTELVGPVTDAAKYLPQGSEWKTVSAIAPVDAIRSAVDTEPWVFLATINTDNNAVIAGEATAVDRITELLGGRVIPLAFNIALHTPLAAQRHQTLYDIHRYAYTPRDDVRFYSAANYGVVDFSVSNPAEVLRDSLIAPLDFPRLVNRVYDDGARLFVEVGPRTSCTPFIRRILTGREHVTVAANPREAPETVGLLRVLAVIAAHRVPFDVERLRKKTSLPPAKLPYEVVLGGSSTRAHILASFPEGHFAERHRNEDAAKQPIFDEADLLEFADGKIASVFGSAYAPIDTYRRRVRLPSPPYLLVHRVMELEGALNEYKPSRIVTEYDIPHDAWYSPTGRAPLAVTIESGQCDLLLISYLGIDLQNQGDLVYRLLDCELTFRGKLPALGKTLRYDIHIDSFVRTGENLLFFFWYNCTVDGERVLEVRNACAGFFSDEDLDSGRGVIDTDADRAKRDGAVRQPFLPPLHTERTELDRDDMLALVHGDFAGVFGPPYDQIDTDRAAYRPATEAMLMIDRAVLDPTGGAWGLGRIVGEQNLAPDDWYFPCHFVDDPVLAGSLMAEACWQLAVTCAIAQGLPALVPGGEFQPLLDTAQRVRCRGQVTPQTGKLIYEMTITRLTLSPHPQMTADVDVWLDDKIVVRFDDLALAIVPRAEHPQPPPQYLLRKPAAFNEHHVEHFATGRISQAFGEDFARFDARRMPRTPNGDLQFLSRVVHKNVTRHQLQGGTVQMEYDVPPDSWFYRDEPAPLPPYSILMEVALQPCGYLSADVGTIMAVPDVPMSFRNLDGDGRITREVDLRGKSVTNDVTLVSTTVLHDIAIQSFTFVLSVDGAPFFDGSAKFGYFTDDALANQVGLDQGRLVKPRLLGEPQPLTDITPLMTGPHDRPSYRLLADHFELIHRAKITDAAVYAEFDVAQDAWFYDAHFYEDPVMPGSLGIEAMFQAMKAYAITHGIGGAFLQPYFTSTLGHRINWRYRGQITRANDLMQLEVVITAVEAHDGRVTLYGDASLWKGPMRIYEAAQLALDVRDAHRGEVDDGDAIT